MGTQHYGYTRYEHEYNVSVPFAMADDHWLVICMSAHGGGTVGQAYAGNGWDYAVYEADALILEGSDIRSPLGRPAGHAEMARSLASFLSSDGEHFWSSHDCPDDLECKTWNDYSEAEREWLAANYERLSLFAEEPSTEPCESCGKPKALNGYRFCFACSNASR